jgi:hypothetical protein
MSVATATFTLSPYPQGLDETMRRVTIYGPVTITASPATYTLGGIPLTLKSGTAGLVLPGTSNPACKTAHFESRANSGYVYIWTAVDLWTALFKSTTPTLGQSLVDTNGNLQTITTSGAAGTGTEPVWNKTKGGTTTDASAVWTNKGVSQGLISIFQQNATTGPLVEIANTTAIAAGISGDTIAGYMEFLKG